jgi:TolB-like protein
LACATATWPITGARICASASILATSLYKDGVLYGDGVNVAARLESLADAGGICISRSIGDQVRDKLDVTLEGLGEHEVKNIARPVRAFRVIQGGAVAAARGGAPAAPTAEPKSESEKPSIAILPFDNMAGDDSQEYFSDGITEDIITALSRNIGLFVIARNSSFAYRGKSPDIRKVGEELGVRYVLEGSVRRAGARITAQLIEAASGNHVWAEKYDSQFTDIFAPQDEITENVTGAVGSEIARAAQMSTAELGAWELAMKAWWHVQRSSKEDNAKAQDLCSQEIVLMGEKATSHSALAFTHLWDSLYGWGRGRESGPSGHQREPRRRARPGDPGNGVLVCGRSCRRHSRVRVGFGAEPELQSPVRFSRYLAVPHGTRSVRPGEGVLRPSPRPTGPSPTREEGNNAVAWGGPLPLDGGSWGGGDLCARESKYWRGALLLTEGKQ